MRPFIPAWLNQAGLSQADFRVYCCLWSRANHSSGIAWPSADTISSDCHMARNTVWKSLRRLEDGGFILRVGKPFQGASRYQVLIPTSAKGTPIEPPTSANEIPIAESPTSANETPPIGANEILQSAQMDSRECNPKNVIHRMVSKEELFSAEELLPFPSPEFKQAWDLWKAHLDEKPKSKRPTKTALKLQLKKLAALGEDRAIADLRHSISSNYQAIYPDPLFQPKAGRPSGIEDVYTYAAESNAQRKHAEAFFDRSEKEGWKDWRGKPIQDWKAAFREFCEKTIPPDAKPPAPKKFLDD